MTKNGRTFSTIYSSDKLTSGIWNPYNYKYGEEEGLPPFSTFAEVKKVKGKKGELKYFKYAPIEYKHLPKGDMLTFNLEKKANNTGKYAYVKENTLLFGTMRAYLGNACVTPYGKWVNQIQEVTYAVNSEFVAIHPFDKFTYFWWAYIKSNLFLKEMPTGNGGTRPRVSPELISKIRVNVPSEKERRGINETLKEIAQSSWRNYIKGKNILNNLQKKYAQ